jgi:hypothetical protein
VKAVDGINFYKFVINPGRCAAHVLCPPTAPISPSFTETIENIFDLSFLMAKGSPSPVPTR